MSITCKNCNHNFKGNYCYNCGQPAETHPINIHFLWHDVQHGLLHFDKGVSYTVKQLFTRPGHTIREYLEGKRVKHFKPISLVFVLAGLVGLVFHYFHINMLAGSVTLTVNGTDAHRARELVVEVWEWISGHYALVSLLQLPFFAIGTFLAFKKIGYNFTEHVVINAFLTGQRLIPRLVFFPLYYWFNETETINPIGGAMNILSFILTFWTLNQLFQTLKGWSVFFRTILSMIISFVLFAAVIALVFIVLKQRNIIT